MPLDPSVSWVLAPMQSWRGCLWQRTWGSYLWHLGLPLVGADVQISSVRTLCVCFLPFPSCMGHYSAWSTANRDIAFHILDTALYILDGHPLHSSRTMAVLGGWWSSGVLSPFLMRWQTHPSFHGVDRWEIAIPLCRNLCMFWQWMLGSLPHLEWHSCSWWVTAVKVVWYRTCCHYLGTWG